MVSKFLFRLFVILQIKIDKSVTANDFVLVTDPSLFFYNQRGANPNPIEDAESQNQKLNDLWKKNKTVIVRMGFSGACIVNANSGKGHKAKEVEQNSIVKRMKAEEKDILYYIDLRNLNSVLDPKLIDFIGKQKNY